MPAISMPYGVLIFMYYFDNKKHHLPHIHAKYGEEEAIVSIQDGKVLEGELKPSKMKLVQAWIEIHKDELMADWELATQGEQLFKIDPLK